MRLCRFNDDRLGLVQGEEVLDVSAALDVLPAIRWPAPPGDLLIAHLDEVRAAAEKAAAESAAQPPQEPEPGEDSTS